MDPSTLERQSTTDVRFELGAFGLTLALAWYYDWRAADLVWSLWLSSLCVGYLVMISQATHMPIQVLRGIRAEKRRFSWRQITLGIAALLAFNGFVLAFFTLHFGMFHYGHGFLLEGFFSPASAYPSSGWGLPRFALSLLPQYYGMVLASTVMQRRLILKPEGLKRMDQPYRSVIKMHILIFVFAGLHALGATNFLFYAATLLAYFFPWKLLKKTPVSSGHELK